MESYNVNFKKKFGQNFLRDERIVRRIVSVSGVTKNDLVIEVGPGGAILTRELANNAKNVVAYEVDDDLEDELAIKLKNCDNVNVIFKDFLKADVSDDIKKYDYDNIFFVSNVPYYITTPIVMKLIDSGVKFKKIVMMVQKEVGDRFSSKPGVKSYSSISVFLNYYYKVKREFNVSRREFIPVPNVDSVIISFSNRENRQELVNEKLFHKLIRDSFRFKRKTIRNNLKQYDLEKILMVLNKYGYDLSVRAEQLSVEIFVEIANELSS